jgi:hypothetical protein
VAVGRSRSLGTVGAVQILLQRSVQESQLQTLNVVPAVKRALEIV